MNKQVKLDRSFNVIACKFLGKQKGFKEYIVLGVH